MMNMCKIIIIAFSHQVRSARDPSNREGSKKEMAKHFRSVVKQSSIYMKPMLDLNDPTYKVRGPDFDY